MSTQKRTSGSKTKIKHKDREISRLRNELAAERRHTAKLEREISDLRREMKANAQGDQPIRRLKQKASGSHKEELLLDEACRRAHHYRKRSFLRYLWESLSESIPFQVVRKIKASIRRLKVVQTIITVLSAVGTAVVVAVLSAAILPFLFIGSSTLTLLALVSSRRMNRLLQKELTDRRIRVMIPPRGDSMNPGSFFIRNARAMAAEENVTVIVVTPYLLSSKRGLGGKGIFFTARKECEDLYLVRRHYFFFMRRKVLDALDGEITTIY